MACIARPGTGHQHDQPERGTCFKWKRTSFWSKVAVVTVPSNGPRRGFFACAAACCAHGGCHAPASQRASHQQAGAHAPHHHVCGGGVSCPAAAPRLHPPPLPPAFLCGISLANRQAFFSRAPQQPARSVQRRESLVAGRLAGAKRRERKNGGEAGSRPSGRNFFSNTFFFCRRLARCPLAKQVSRVFLCVGRSAVGSAILPRGSSCLGFLSRRRAPASRALCLLAGRCSLINQHLRGEQHAQPPPKTAPQPNLCAVGFGRPPAGWADTARSPFLTATTTTAAQRATRKKAASSEKIATRTPAALLALQARLCFLVRRTAERPRTERARCVTQQQDLVPAIAETSSQPPGASQARAPGQHRWAGMCVRKRMAEQAAF